MAAVRVFAVMCVALVQLSYADTSGVLRAGPASADSKLADTVRALDTNGNGKVDKSELAVFAKSQGLSSDEVMSEFKELDVNNDGALDASEIGPLFGADADAKTKAVGTPSALAEAEVLAAQATKPLSAAAVPIVNKKREELKSAPAAGAATAEFSHFTSSDQLTSYVADETTVEKMGIDLSALERDAQDQAGGVIANRLAQRAQVLLARSAADEHKAKAFDVEVRTLRGNATALAKSANEEARAAARAATKAVSKEAMARLETLQVQESKAAIAADQHRKEAREAMVRVRKAQASLRSS